MPSHRFSTTGAYGRLFVFCLSFFASATTAADPCLPATPTTPAEIRHVIDGDTLLLVDGQRVRMVGLDAPELGRDGAPDEPLAREAADHLNVLISIAGKRVSLQTGPELRDRYGRLLAVVYSDRHGDLAAHLLRRGLAFAAPVPPNLMGMDCHRAAEAEARTIGRGLWGLGSGPVVAASQLGNTGFAILRGRASGWTMRRDDRFLTLDDAVVLRFRQADIERWFDADELAAYADQHLEVRGWVHPWGRNGRAITVQHPANIEVMRD